MARRIEVRVPDTIAIGVVREALALPFGQRAGHNAAGIVIRPRSGF